MKRKEKNGDLLDVHKRIIGRPFIFILLYIYIYNIYKFIVIFYYFVESDLNNIY